LHPMQVRYQAALRPDEAGYYSRAILFCHASLSERQRMPWWQASLHACKALHLHLN
jgi:hypothetical protein